MRGGGIYTIRREMEKNNNKIYTCLKGKNLITFPTSAGIFEVEMEINGNNKEKALIDSCANISICGPKIFESVPRERLQRIEEPIHLVGVKGSPLPPVVTALKIPFEVNDIRDEVVAFFVESFPDTLIIGGDFLEEHGGIVDFRRGIFSYLKGLMEISIPRISNDKVRAHRKAKCLAIGRIEVREDDREEWLNCLNKIKEIEERGVEIKTIEEGVDKRKI